MKTKICTGECGKEKPETEEFFYFRKDNNKFRNECKECFKKIQKISNKIYYKNNREKINKQRLPYTEKYRKEIKPWFKSYSNAKQRCTNPKNPDYKYYGEKNIEFKLTLNEVEYLWIRDQAWLLKQPSIDRINNNGHYELGNCQFIEMEINRIKDRNKSIIQFDLQGNFIREWKSIKLAGQQLNIASTGIIGCAKKYPNYSHAGGYFWEYKNA